MKKWMSVIATVFFMLPILLTTAIPGVQAQNYPSEDIRWVLGGKPGGGFDIYARAIGRSMEKYLPKGVHVIVENKPGAGHRIAMSTVHNAKPDGYTIGMPLMAGLFIDQMYAEQKYDMKKATWLAMLLHDPRVLTVAAKGPYKSLEDLRKAEGLRVAINGFASESDVILANGKIGINAQYIAGHASSNEAVLACLRGDADIAVFTFGSLQDFIRDKQLLPLAVYGSEQRIPEIPDVPTLAELGHPELNQIVGNFRVVSAQPDLPPERLAYLRDVMKKAMHDPEFLDTMQKANRQIDYKDGETTTRIMHSLIGEYEKLKEDLRPYYELDKK